MRVSLPSHTDVGEGHIPLLLLWPTCECSSVVLGWTKELASVHSLQSTGLQRSDSTWIPGQGLCGGEKHGVVVWLSQGWTQQMWSTCNSEGVPLLPKGVCPSSLAAGLSGWKVRVAVSQFLLGKTPINWWERFVCRALAYLPVMIIIMNMSFSLFMLLWFYFGFIFSVALRTR